MFAVFAQYGKGLPTFRSSHKTETKARKVADRISAAGNEANIFKVTKIMETAQNDTAPASRPDSENARTSS